MSACEDTDRTRRAIRPVSRRPGEHLKRHRLDLSLTQVAAARRVGVCAQTLANWECGRAQPPVGRMPPVIAFLGYDPHPEPKTVGDELRIYRRALGLTQRAFAAKLGVGRSTLNHVEGGRSRLSERLLRKVREYLGSLLE